MVVWTRDEVDEWFAGDTDAALEQMAHERNERIIEIGREIDETLSTIERVPQDHAEHRLSLFEHLGALNREARALTGGTSAPWLY